MLPACNAADDTPPNIVLIMADDLGYGDIACYGSEYIKTPAIDLLASEGMKFTDYHSNGPVCTPTRAALMTGKYQQKVGLEGVIYVKGESRKTGLDVSELTIANLFREAGYSTGIMGKWHLGYKKEYNPFNHGYDEFYGYVSGNIDYHSHYDNAGIYDWWHNLDTIVEEGYSTDLITEHSIDFIRNNRDKHFFLYIPHEAPHVPFQGRKDSAYRIPGRTFSYLGPVEDQQAAYKEMVEVMDEGIGQIMQTLRELNLDQNTIVFFCSDNGARFGSNGELRGDKGSVWEGGHRVPAIAWYPDFIEAGSTTDEVVISMDLVPTLLTMAGIETSASFDGIDFSSVMLRQSPLKERPLFWRYHGQLAVRKGNWKYLSINNEEYLFNLQADLAEENNQIDQNTEITKEMKTLLTNWENEMEAYKQKTK
jgi:arylsulfatase A